MRPAVVTACRRELVSSEDRDSRKLRLEEVAEVTAHIARYEQDRGNRSRACCDAATMFLCDRGLEREDSRAMRRSIALRTHLRSCRRPCRPRPGTGAHRAVIWRRSWPRRCSTMPDDLRVKRRRTWRERDRSNAARSSIERLRRHWRSTSSICVAISAPNHCAMGTRGQVAV